VVSSRTGHCLHPRSSSSSIVFILDCLHPRWHHRHFRVGQGHPDVGPGELPDRTLGVGLRFYSGSISVRLPDNSARKLQ
jgi:hypothetical protein